MNTPQGFFAIALLSAASIAAPASATQIVLYNFDGMGDGTNSNTAANVAGGVATPASFDAGLLSSASAIDTVDDSDATGVRLRFRGGSLSSSGGNEPGASAVVPVLEARVGTPGLLPDPAKYFHFSLVANADLQLTTLSFDMAKGSSDASDRGVQVLLSLDDFATSTDLGTVAVVTGTGTTDLFFHFDVDLLGAQVSPGQTMTFRLHPYLASGGTGGIRFDNLSVNVVPEPATLATLAAAATLALLRRRQA